MDENHNQLIEIITELSNLSGVRIAVALGRGKKGNLQVVSGKLRKGIVLEALAKRMEEKEIPDEGGYYQEDRLFAVPFSGNGTGKGLVVGFKRDARLAKLLSAIIYLWEDKWLRERENVSLAEEIASRYEQLVLSFRLSQEIGTIDNPERMVRIILKCLLKVVGAREGFLVRYSGKGRCQELAALVNEEGKGGGKSSLTTGMRKKLAAVCFQRRRPFVANDLSRDPELNGFKSHISSVLFSSLREKSDFRGALVLVNKIDRAGFLTDDLKLVNSVSSQAATALENARLFADLRRLFVSVTEALAEAIDAKDPYTAGHSRKVTRICLALAEEMGFARERKTTVHLASLLHDVGKIGVEEAILTKPARLTEAEFARIKAYPEIGARILEHIPQLAEIIPIIRHHHERFDGRGYPGGIAGERIPLESRMLAVADSFDAMMSDRAYRKAIGLKKTREELIKNRGTRFDPEVVDKFLKMDISRFAKKDSVTSRKSRTSGNFVDDKVAV